MDPEPELRDALRRDCSAGRTERRLHHRRAAVAPDRRGRDLHPVGRRRVFLPAEPSRPEIPGKPMSITTTATATQDPLRPPATGLKAWLAAWLAKRIPFAFRLARALAPIVRFRNIVLVTRYDDVREVFLNDQA